MRKMVRVCVLAAVAGSLLLAGCVTVAAVLTPSASVPAKGDDGAITGRLTLAKNQYVLSDASSGVAYRFVGLTKTGAAQLSPYVGKTVTVRLTVISTESAKAVNARFIEVVR
jgi:outer membrane murein-binding lipoprotein Lpp